MKLFIKPGLVGLIGLVSSSLSAAPYQVELGGAYGYIDSDQSEAVASAEMYFIPVNPDQHVLAEAAFLERASSLKIRYGQASLFYDGENVLTGNELVDFTYTQFSVDWYGTTTGLYLAFSQETLSPDDDDEEFPDYDNWTGKLGFMPMHGILVYTTYQDESGYDPNLSVKYVSNISNGKAVNLEATYIDYSDDDNEEDGEDKQNYLMVGMDIYLNRQFSFGGTIGQQDDTIFGLRTRYFVNPTVSLSAFARTGDDIDEFGIGFDVRF